MLFWEQEQFSDSFTHYRLCDLGQVMSVSLCLPTLNQEQLRCLPHTTFMRRKEKHTWKAHGPEPGAEHSFNRCLPYPSSLLLLLSYPCGVCLPFWSNSIQQPFIEILIRIIYQISLCFVSTYDTCHLFLEFQHLIHRVPQTLR